VLAATRDFLDAVIVVVVVLVYDFITTQTVLGRHIYAIGGNPEAAELSGISVKKITYLVFGSMGMLSVYLYSVCIAFAVCHNHSRPTVRIGCHCRGIYRRRLTGRRYRQGDGSLIGALVMTSLTSGMNLMSLDISTSTWSELCACAAVILMSPPVMKENKDNR